MAIPLADQYAQVMGTGTALQAKVGAAIEAQAIVSFTAAANPDATIQKKRLVLASAVLKDVRAYLVQWSWIVVTRPSLTTVDDLTDTQIKTVVANSWDQAAAQLVPDTAIV